MATYWLNVNLLTVPTMTTLRDDHQPSLEDILNRVSGLRLDSSQRTRASGTFHRICDHFDTSPTARDWSRSKLLRATYTHGALTPEAGDRFLGAFFASLQLSMDVDYESMDWDGIGPRFEHFAKTLFYNFFVPSIPRHHLATPLWLSYPPHY